MKLNQTCQNTWQKRQKVQHTLAVLFLALAASNVGATELPCRDAGYRDFDFWIGRWQVSTAEGAVIGHNHISSIAGGCGLMEEWSGADGGNGKSLIVYLPEHRQWRQLWTASSGEHSDRTGGASADGMVLGDPPGAPHQGRDILRAVSPDELRQTEQVSEDGGRHWTTVFTGIYRRLPDQP
ncbi:MAG: hypothetical protein JSR19_13060 [Proteobacteria bacterium]|nr:hypothetical protein [Pseudomonadota bacterium]HQR04643.1 hypothetical protein [Rhodocyclaceae bacterium]